MKVKLIIIVCLIATALFAVAQQEGAFIEIIADSKYVEQFKKTSYWKKTIEYKKKEKISVRLYFLSEKGDQLEDLRSIQADISTRQLESGVFKIRIWNSSYLDKIEQMKKSFKIDFFQRRGHKFLFQIYTQSCIIEKASLAGWQNEPINSGVSPHPLPAPKQEGLSQAEETMLSELQSLERDLDNFDPRKGRERIKNKFESFLYHRYDPLSATIKGKYKDRIERVRFAVNRPDYFSQLFDQSRELDSSTLRTTIKDLQRRFQTLIKVKETHTKYDFNGDVGYSREHRTVLSAYTTLLHLLVLKTYEQDKLQRLGLYQLIETYETYQNTSFKL